MNGCPLAYTDTCDQCDYSENCSPGKAIEKLELMETQMYDIKMKLEEILRTLTKS